MITTSGKPGVGYILNRIREIILPPVRITALPAGIVATRDLQVPLRDGAQLAVNVYRPQTPGRYPTLVCAHPYGKDRLPRKTPFGYLPLLQTRVLRQVSPVAYSDQTSWEAPDPGRWVPRGYVVVNADLRGFFKSRSEGGPGEVMSDQEAEDYYDLIEWAAAQPWSNGKIGLNGVSYLAISQWKVAALHPPHLCAICPWEGFTDAYRDLFYPGGVREDGFAAIWGRGVKSRTNVRTEQLRRPTRDAWFRSLTPELSRITVPALICGSFSDQSLHTGGAFRAFATIASSQKWLYTHRGGKWATYYGDDALAWQYRFFDHFLKDADNGMESVPAVRLAVHDTRTGCSVRAESAWPLPSVQRTRLYLDAAASELSREPRAAAEVSFDLRRGRASFSYRFDRDTELTGPMTLAAPIALEGTTDANLFVTVHKLRDGRHLSFEGSYGFAYDPVTKGWQRVALRALDTQSSRPWQPEHDFAHLQPLAEGERAELSIALLPSATLFRAGDTLRLDIQGRWPFIANPLLGAGPAAYQASPPGRCRLYTGTGSPAYLLIPEVQPT